MVKTELDFKWLEENVPFEMVENIERIIKVQEKRGYVDALKVRVEEKKFEDDIRFIYVYIITYATCHSFFYKVGQHNYVHDAMSHSSIPVLAKMLEENEVSN